MTPAQAEMVDHARESIAAARLLLDAGHAGFAASRAYYAMFYLAEALLEGLDLSFSKHSAVIAAFGRELVKAGRVPAELHRFLLEGMELRQAGDYGAGSEVSAASALEQVARAEKFLAVVTSVLGADPAE